MLLQYKIIGILALIGGLLLGYFAWEHRVEKRGYDRANAEWAEKNHQADLAAADDLKILNDQAARDQAYLNEAQATIIEKTKDLKNAQADYTDMRDKYLANERRLSIATAASARDKAEQAHNSGATVKPTETRTNIMPDDAKTILDAARGSSSDVRDLNLCIDLYNAAREAVNR